MDADDDRDGQTRQANYRAISERLDSLPLLPSVVTRLISLDRDDDAYFEGILELGEQDPTFAVRLIRIANSSAFFPASPITDLRSAVTRIGVREIAGLVTSLAMMRVFVPSKRQARELWLHSVQVAVSARLLAQRYYRSRVNPGSAYLCGLLHDIGRFIVIDVVPGELNWKDQEGCNESEPPTDLEQRVLGISHTELGSLICKRWQVPDLIGSVAKMHHVRRVSDATGGDSRLRDLVSITWVADHFSLAILSSAELAGLPEPEAVELLDRACIRPFNDVLPLAAGDLYAMLPTVVEQAAALCAALDLPID